MKVLATRVLTALLLLLGVQVGAGEVSVSAAASLRESLGELSSSFAKTHPGVTILRNHGASGTLAKQLEAGAPADLYISADQAWMDYLRDRNLVQASSITTLAFNALVFVGAPGKAATLQDLAKLERIAIGSPKSVPAGEYALAALKRAGLDRLLEKKLVQAKDVRECLMYAERGEVDGAFVYATDALQATRARLLFRVPQELYPRVVYPMALTPSGAAKPEAVAFFTHLQSADAKVVLAKHGFSVQ
ncbi:MAG: molybdate ABC transporter substrate-binding protein [Holophagaceae bacterium]|nr:molybdate ABC transporter substrate-binding protein [Holophagaceae bacterium]